MVEERINFALEMEAAGFINPTQRAKQVAQEFLTVLEKFKRTGKDAAKVSEDLGRLASAEKVIQRTANTIKKMHEASTPLLTTLTNMRGKLLMLALGMLFFGMAMKRFAENIISGTVAMFRKVMEESGYFGSALQQLGVQWNYLKFAIGGAINTALEPLKGKIEGVIEKISEWINQHPKLTAGILFAIAALGSLLFIIGTFAAPLGTLITFFGGIISSILAFGAALIGTFGIGAILAFAAILIAIVHGLYSAWTENFAGMRNYVKGIWEGLKKWFGGMFDILRGIFGLFFSLITGDWEGVKKNFMLIWEGAKNAIIGGVEFIYNSIVALGIGVFKAIYDIVNMVIDAIMDVIKWAKKAWDWVKKIAGKGGETNLGNYAVGGQVSGLLGEPQLAILHGGERVIDRQSQNTFGNINVTVNTTGGVNGKSIADEILREIKRHVNVGGI